MKKYIVGGLVGATLMFSTQGFAADAIEKVEAYIKNQPVKLNGQAVILDSPALVYDGSTYLKLRDAAKLTGLNVNWNEQTQTVELENTNTSTPQKPIGVNVPSQAQPAAPQTNASNSPVEDKYAGKVFVSSEDLGDLFKTPERKYLSFADKSEKQNDSFFGHSDDYKTSTMYYSIDFLIKLGVKQSELENLPKYKVINNKIQKI
ncbi:copper amine oxidase N-terminal domain-containing protein [Paenibacillus sp. FSL H7-0331]|uniref:copper amine oxidase N-terminal domain-containing protein n=1 Tax=Paenibacillus sp. FSL H7-0331 TaxID=1920421 RepID=UPI00096F827C|nr:copper amine oxidase N-terminal domain-containing protein [Paenibacillus sp. FSL H7-0331]OMF11905.1 hypothetical protein BK127_23410 [Paenibacillus sp. FSL H7-0331]